MATGPYGDGKKLHKQDRGPDGGNRRVLGNLVLILGICVILATVSPVPLRAAAVSNFLIIASFGVAISALLHRQKPFVPYLTRWDQAVVLYLLGMLAATVVDPDAMQNFLQTESQTGALPATDSATL
ncbi:hypothetical protein EOI86_00875 [Hwanghaeella grinnelliae]|uniref:Uncharacterized protein n=1 Tax=Hwanghaeella grinnelliae TaxID=2500179 RepID=A0A3S3UQ31_9PROT|nr:hypothetical protein [Hwanghaeella grinnelliae]RVU37889.1 hypothetical protein EOI86_00875 [Hwanghaeella grinnelliae]